MVFDKVILRGSPAAPSPTALTVTPLSTPLPDPPPPRLRVDFDWRIKAGHRTTVEFVYSHTTPEGVPFYYREG